MNDIVPVELSTIVTLHERDLDRQITTAKKFPRSIGRAREQITLFATETEETAEECIYALPRDGKVIKGPSARFAEIVASSFGNARFASRIIDEDAHFVTAQAVFHDLENNTYISLEVKRRIVTKDGNRYSLDMIGTTSNAAMSIALRNAILKGVPRSVWGDGYAKAHAMVAGTFENVKARRTKAVEAFRRQGVTDEMLLALLHKEQIGEIEPDDIVVMRGLLSAVRDGDTTIEAVFGVNNARAAAKADGRSKVDVSGKLKEGRENDDRRKAAGGDGKVDRPDTAKDAQADDKAASPAQDRQEGPEPKSDVSNVDTVDGPSEPSGDAGSRVAEPDGASNASAQDPAGDASSEIELSDALSSILDNGEYAPGDQAKLAALASELMSCVKLSSVNTVDAKHRGKFETAPEDVVAASRSMIKARMNDIRASGAARNKL